jgi:hypothetical protein
MLEQCSELKLYHFAASMEQLTSLGMVPRDPDSVAKAFADLKMSWLKRTLPEKQCKLKLKHLLRQMEP